MCGRYYIEEENAPEEINQIISRMQRFSAAGKPVKVSGEVFPTDWVSTIARNKAGKPDVFAMQWGYHFSNGKCVINARSESAQNKDMFRDGMNQRRCLLPASAYFEWKHTTDGKIKYRIQPENHHFFYLAGIYRIENNTPVCCILTKAATEQMLEIHPRMPVMLSNAQCSFWLDSHINPYELIDGSLSKMDFVRM